jgi:hypothetical protein
VRLVLALAMLGGVAVSAAPARIDVPLADAVPSILPAEGVPAGWTLREFAGQADVELVRVDGRIAMRLKSDRASFAVHRDVVVDLAEYPVLTWSWKVVRLPAGGDVRQTARDDQAAQVYIIFPRWPAPLKQSEVIGYVWDSTAPAGTRLTSTRAGNVRLVVVESGARALGSWRRYERDVAQDYTALFGKTPPRVGKVAIMIDSNDTRSDAEAFWTPLSFRRTR